MVRRNGWASCSLQANLETGRAVKGDRVGMPYHGDCYERPIGLTTEQNESQRFGAKIDERHVRESRPRRARRHAAARNLRGTDEVTERRKGAKKK